MRAGALCLVLLLCSAVACDGSNTVCTYDSDCPEGQRCADGQCSPRTGADQGVTPDEGMSADLGPVDGSLLDEELPADQGTGDAATCVPNGNGQVDRDEMPLKVGITVPYSSGTEITVNLAGSEEQGQLTWDLTADAPDEGPLQLPVEEVFSWASSDFPQASYVTPLDLDSGSWGVFQLSQDALSLQGYVSEEPDTINLIYSEPVTMLPFPLAEGQQVESSAFLSGFMNGLYLYLFETYTVDVLAAGQLKLPQLNLDALLVRVVSTQAPVATPLLMTTKVTFLFVSECYGIVAQVFAEDDPGDDLQQVLASERRRLTF